MEYKHFSVEEREKIQYGLWEKRSIRSIAKELGRSPSSVAREIKKNLPSELRRYAPRKAHEQALHNRTRRGREERLKNESVREYVIKHLRRRWSPEQIAGRIKTDLCQKISHEAIYQFIYAQFYQGGHGTLKPGREDLRIFLRRRRKRRIPKGARRCQRIFKPSGISIDARPAVVAERSRIGDWESDTVESCAKKPGVNTVVERATGLVFMTKLENKTSAATVATLAKRFSSLPRSLRKTLTLDNGPENSDWPAIEEKTGMDCFFAHAYHSWERGTNENTNGLIRDYFPKKTDFTIISEGELAHVERELNERPRKRLQWKTPLEVMGVALQC